MGQIQFVPYIFSHTLFFQHEMLGVALHKAMSLGKENYELRVIKL